MTSSAPKPYIRSIDFGGVGPTLLFAHANGFPPASYRRMLHALTQRFHVRALEFRALTTAQDPEPTLEWSALADDYVQFLEQAKIRNAYGIGHSLGAVLTLMAANRRPEAFAELTLIEPVILPPWLAATMQWMPYGLRMRSGMPLKALTRTDTWPSAEATFADLRERRVFQRIDDEGLWDYVRAATVHTPQGDVRLRYSRAWEAHIYATVPRIWRYVDEVEVPVRILRGVLSDHLEAGAADGWIERRPDHQLVEVDCAGHLLPLERPFETASLIHADARRVSYTASK